MRGRFISLEGGEGAGKSTQAKALEAHLRALGFDVVETREPGGTPGADAIRTLLLMGDEQRWTPEAEALLFAAARSDHVTQVIRPALERGAWVISDRFVDSSIAYQGGAGGLGYDAIRSLHEIGSQGFLPDRTLLLELPVEDADRRVTLRDLYGQDLIGRRGAEYHHNVIQAFRDLAQADPARIRVVDASGSPDQVTARLVAEIEDLL